MSRMHQNEIISEQVFSQPDRERVFLLHKKQAQNGYPRFTSGNRPDCLHFRKIIDICVFPLAILVFFLKFILVFPLKQAREANLSSDFRMIQKTGGQIFQTLPPERRLIFNPGQLNSVPFPGYMDGMVHSLGKSFRKGKYMHTEPNNSKRFNEGYI